MISKDRPLSPHLTIYKLQISSVLSILHRITGMALFLGVLILAWLLTAILMQNTGIAFIDAPLSGILDNVLFKIFLLGLSFCLYYHLFNGIRHLFWDIGLGFEIRTMKITGIIVVCLSLLFTLATVYLATVERL